MTCATGPRLPQSVVLPDQPLLPAWHLRHALGASRQVLHLWRSKYAFPQSHRESWSSVTSTAAVADWLREHGVEVSLQ